MTMDNSMTQNHSFGKQGFSLEKMRASRLEAKKLKKEIRSTEVFPGLGEPINWKAIQDTETTSKVFTFSPSPEIRKIFVKLLSAPHSSLSVKQKAKKMEILQKLRKDFIRTYEKYRFEVNKEMGKKETWINFSSMKSKQYEKIISTLIQTSITPVEVFHYWHYRLSNFANPIPYIPLPILSNGSMIEEAAMNATSTRRKFTGLDESKKTDWKAPKKKTMFLGDTSTLHPHLRRELMAAGFDLSKYNDADLSTIQDYAMDVKSGEVGIKIIPEALRDIIRWALKNTLKDFEPKDSLYKH